MNSWTKKGKIYCPSGEKAWAKSHAQVPTPMVLDKDTLRVFYSTRDDKNISRVSYIDVNAHNPGEIIYEHDGIVLDVGTVGTFDDCGVMPSWIARNNEEIYLYYIGWNVRNTVPYYNSIGLAISIDNGTTFEKFSQGPLWDRDFLEPYFSATTCVIKDSGIWRCYYLSCTGYQVVKGQTEPRYHLKYAESDDGIIWKREGNVAIDYKHENEGGIVKASVIVENGRYRMWYSYRDIIGYRSDSTRSYRIGYAESKDGLTWVRLDDFILFDDETSQWDNHMMAYPHVIKIDYKYFMFYNGNGFGYEGFGYAEMKE